MEDLTVKNSYIVYGLNDCTLTQKLLGILNSSDHNVEYKIMTSKIFNMMKQALEVRTVTTPQVFQILEDGEHFWLSSDIIESFNLRETIRESV